MRITKELIDQSKKYNHAELRIEKSGSKNNLVLRNVFSNVLHPFPGGGHKVITIPPSQLVEVNGWVYS